MISYSKQWEATRTRSYQKEVRKDKEKKGERYQPSISSDNFLFTSGEIMICDGRARKDQNEKY